jgi:coenzyme PQQ precursor peptide PqqA
VQKSLPRTSPASATGPQAASARLEFFEPTTREVSMLWKKPEFELVELCSEVTSYFYHR